MVHHLIQGTRGIPVHPEAAGLALLWDDARFAAQLAVHLSKSKRFLLNSLHELGQLVA